MGGDVDAHTEGLEELGRGRPGQRLQVRRVDFDLLVETEPADGEGYQGMAHGHCGVGQVAGNVECSAGGQEPEVAQRFELVTQARSAVTSTALRVMMAVV